MGKPADEGSTSRPGVTKADLDRPSIQQSNASRFARSRLSQPPLSREGGTSGQECWLLCRAKLSKSNSRENSLWLRFRPPYRKLSDDGPVDKRGGDLVSWRPLVRTQTLAVGSWWPSPSWLEMTRGCGDWSRDCVGLFKIHAAHYQQQLAGDPFLQSKLEISYW